MKKINNNDEMKIYEFLGVKQFKKLTFKLEKFIHRKDKNKNINYHIVDSDNLESVNSFKKYLFYNGSIHARNLMFGVPSTFLLTIIGGNAVLLGMIYLILIKDLYCVMLQRYNWIRIKNYELKLKERNEKLINKKGDNLKSERADEAINENLYTMLFTLENWKNYLMEINEKNYLDTCKTDVNDCNVKKKVLIKSKGVKDYEK